MIKTVVWDWNGTLFNDAWLCVDVMNGLLQERGLPLLTAERYQAVFDFPVRLYYERLGFDLQKESFEELGTAFIEAYEMRKYEGRLQTGAEQVVAGFQAAGIRQAVLSAYHRKTLAELLRHYGLFSYFSPVLGLDDHYAAGKTEVGLAWVNQEQLDPKHMLLIGDTVHDYEVAEAIGCRSVLIPSGNHSREKLEACNVPVLDDLYAVKAYVYAQLPLK